MDTRGAKRRHGDCASTAAAVESTPHGGAQAQPDKPPHSPGYAAGYDAGFQAGLLAASQGGALPPGRGVIAI